MHLFREHKCWKYCSMVICPKTLKMTVKHSDYINNLVFALEMQQQGRIVGIVTRLQARLEFKSQLV